MKTNIIRENPVEKQSILDTLYSMNSKEWLNAAQVIVSTFGLLMAKHGGTLAINWLFSNPDTLANRNVTEEHDDKPQEKSMTLFEPKRHTKHSKHSMASNAKLNDEQTKNTLTTILDLLDPNQLVQPWFNINSDNSPNNCLKDLVLGGTASIVTKNPLPILLASPSCFPVASGAKIANIKKHNLAKKDTVGSGTLKYGEEYDVVDHSTFLIQATLADNRLLKVYNDAAGNPSGQIVDVVNNIVLAPFSILPGDGQIEEVIGLDNGNIAISRIGNGGIIDSSDEGFSIAVTNDAGNNIVAPTVTAQNVNKAQWRPKMIPRDGGGLLSIWHSNHNTTTGYDLMCRALGPDLFPITDEITLLPMGTITYAGASATPVMARFVDGTIVLLTRGRNTVSGESFASISMIDKDCQLFNTPTIFGVDLQFQLGLELTQTNRRFAAFWIENSSNILKVQVGEFDVMTNTTNLIGSITSVQNMSPGGLAKLKVINKQPEDWIMPFYAKTGASLANDERGIFSRTLNIAGSNPLLIGSEKKVNERWIESAQSINFEVNPVLEYIATNYQLAYLNFEIVGNGQLELRNRARIDATALAGININQTRSYTEDVASQIQPPTIVDNTWTGTGIINVTYSLTNSSIAILSAPPWLTNNVSVTISGHFSTVNQVPIVFTPQPNRNENTTIAVIARNSVGETLNGVINMIGQAENDAPTLTLSPFALNEGGDIALGPQYITVNDLDNSASELTLYFLNAQHVTIYHKDDAQQTPITQCMYDVYANNEFRIKHDGGEVAGSFDVQVNDGLITTVPVPVDMTFAPDKNDPPTFTTYVPINTGETVALDNTKINATDPDNSRSELFYTTIAPNGVMFTFKSSPNNAVNNFSQIDIDANKVQITHLPQESLNPSVMLELTDGSNKIQQLLNLIYNPTNTPPSFGFYGNITIIEGEITRFNNTQFYLQDTQSLLATLFLTPKNCPHLQFKNNLGQAVGSFAGDAAVANKIDIEDDGSEGTRTCTIEAVDPGGLSSGLINMPINFVPQNDRPRITKASFNIVEDSEIILGGSDIIAVDDDADQVNDDLEIVIIQHIGVDLFRESDPLPLSQTSFLISELKSGKIHARADGTTNNLVLSLKAIDKHGMESQEFNVSIQVISSNDAPFFTTLLQDQSIPVGKAVDINVPEPNDEDDTNLIVTVTKENGSILPDWLNFDPSTLKITSPIIASSPNGAVRLPTYEETGKTRLKISVSDEKLESSYLVTFDVQKSLFVTNLAQTINVDEDTSPSLNAGVVVNTASDKVSVIIELGDPQAGKLLANSVGNATATFQDVGKKWVINSGNVADVNTLLKQLVLQLSKDYDKSSFPLNINIDDGANKPLMGAITITVTPKPDSPVVITENLDDPIIMALGEADSYQLPENAFEDPDTGDSLTFLAESSDGGPLPKELAFAAATRRFDSNFENDSPIEVVLTITDSTGLSAKQTLKFQPTASPSDSNSSKTQWNTTPAGTFGVMAIGAFIAICGAIIAKTAEHRLKQGWRPDRKSRADYPFADFLLSILKEKHNFDNNKKINNFKSNIGKEYLAAISEKEQGGLLFELNEALLTVIFGNNTHPRSFGPFIGIADAIGENTREVIATISKVISLEIQVSNGTVVSTVLLRSHAKNIAKKTKEKIVNDFIKLFTGKHPDNDAKFYEEHEVVAGNLIAMLFSRGHFFGGIIDNQANEACLCAKMCSSCSEVGEKYLERLNIAIPNVSKVANVLILNTLRQATEEELDKFVSYVIANILKGDAAININQLHALSQMGVSSSRRLSNPSKASTSTSANSDASTSSVLINNPDPTDKENNPSHNDEASTSASMNSSNNKASTSSVLINNLSHENETSTSVLLNNPDLSTVQTTPPVSEPLVLAQGPAGGSSRLFTTGKKPLASDEVEENTETEQTFNNG